MYISVSKILFKLYLQCNQILNIFGNEAYVKRLTRNSESAHWPLQAGYSGLHIKKLNEYVSLFSHCLVNIQNYQGIEIVGIKSPVYITRFDVAYLKECYFWDGYKTGRFFFGRIPPKSERNCSTDHSHAIKHTDKSFTARWHCTAQFDIFFPEPGEAPHIFYLSQKPQSHQDVERNLFDIALEYIVFRNEHREGWSKIL